MDVAEEHPAGKVEHQGRSYYFCSASCVQKFQTDPQISDPSTLRSSPSPGTQKVEYTCPMDPEVRRMGPGTCPKCGMALEPVNFEAPGSRVEYTCPMHPEIVRDEPGFCPICGMALEPREVTEKK